MGAGIMSAVEMLSSSRRLGIEIRAFIRANIQYNILETVNRCS